MLFIRRRMLYLYHIVLSTFYVDYAKIHVSFVVFQQHLSKEGGVDSVPACNHSWGHIHTCMSYTCSDACLHCPL